MALREKSNLILERLPSQETRAISRELEPVSLEKHTSIHRPGKRADYVYFPTGSVLSFLGHTGTGTIEVWSVGDEGVVGLEDLLGYSEAFEAVVQVPGTALRGKVSVFRKYFEARKAFQASALQYLHDLVIQISYLGICNNSHPLTQRLSRWLLIMQERAGNKTLHFTHDVIAGALGTRRATISVAASDLQAAGAISYTPGAITIRSRRTLRRLACDCYRVINAKRSQ